MEISQSIGDPQFWDLLEKRGKNEEAQKWQRRWDFAGIFGWYPYQGGQELGRALRRYWNPGIGY